MRRTLRDHRRGRDDSRLVAIAQTLSAAPAVGARAGALGSTAREERNCGARDGGARQSHGGRSARSARPSLHLQGVAAGQRHCPAGTTSRRVRAKAIAELKASIAADPARASAQEALRTAEGYAAADAVDPAPPRPEIRALDRAAAVAPDEDRRADRRDPRRARGAGEGPGGSRAAYFVAAQILIDRGEYDRAIAIAAHGAAASDTFIDENLSAYMLPGKSQGSYARGRSQAADLTGWALFLKKDYAGAKAKLEEAERLSQGADFANQFHLGELARTQNACRAGARALSQRALAGWRSCAAAAARARRRSDAHADRPG